MALIPYRPGETFAVKCPCLSVLASLTVFTPSRTTDTSAPAIAFPLLSRTEPVIVASDFLELAATASLDTSDTSASRDKLKANALLMQKTSATKVPLEAVERRTGSGEETLPGTEKQPVIVCHAANGCQVNDGQNSRSGAQIAANFRPC